MRTCWPGQPDDLHLPGAAMRAGLGSLSCNRRLEGEEDGEGALREEEQSSLGNGAAFAVVGEDAVVADAGEVAWEEVPAEAEEELSAGKFEGLDPVAVGIVAIGKADGAGARIDLLEPGVGNGDAMGVIGQIAKRLLRSAEGALEMDLPVLVVEGPESREAGALRPAQLRIDAAQPGHELAAEERA